MRRGISLVRRNNEWHHFDPLGTAGVITNGSAQVVSNNLYDLLGVLRHPQGSAQTPWRWKRERLGDEAMVLGLLNWCWVVKPGVLCIGPGCRGNPKCPPRPPLPPPPVVTPYPVPPSPPCNHPGGCISPYPDPCPPGTAFFGGFCFGQPEGCVMKFNPLIGGEPMRNICMACCDSVGGQLGWNAKQKARCENACMLVGLPN